VDELDYQIRRSAPSEGWYGVAWQTYSVSRRGVPFWDSACFSDIVAFIEALRSYPTALSVKNLYFPHATFKAPDCSKRRNPPQLDRHARNFLATRTVAIDGDVKPVLSHRPLSASRPFARCWRRSASSHPSSC